VTPLRAWRDPLVTRAVMAAIDGESARLRGEAPSAGNRHNAVRNANENARGSQGGVRGGKLLHILELSSMPEEGLEPPTRGL